MSLLTIPGAISSAVSSLSHHGHKKGVRGAENSALNGTSGTEADPGSAQGLFGSLLDSAEQVLGLQAPASASSAGGAAGSTSVNSGKLAPAAMITAARSMLQKA